MFLGCLDGVFFGKLLTLPCIPLFCFRPESRAPASSLADGGVNSGAALGYCSWMHVYLLLFTTFTLLFNSVDNNVSWQ